MIELQDTINGQEEHRPSILILASFLVFFFFGQLPSLSLDLLFPRTIFGTYNNFTQKKSNVILPKNKNLYHYHVDNISVDK